MFAIELYFDYGLDHAVRTLWNALVKHQLTAGMLPINGARPHLSLAICNDCQPEDVARELEQLLQEAEVFPLTFDAVGTFPVTGTVFLAPTVTESLLARHRRLCGQLLPHLVQPSEYYLPDRWVPHCTLANQVSTGELGRILDFCQRRFTPLRGKATEVGLVRFETTGQQKNTRELLFSIRLAHPET